MKVNEWKFNLSEMENESIIERSLLDDINTLPDQPQSLFMIKSESINQFDPQTNETKHTHESSYGLNWKSLAKGLLMVAQVVIQIVILILLI
jgi:hypothetical protein